MEQAPGGYCLSLLRVSDVELGLLVVPNSHCDISGCRSVEELQPAGHVTTGWDHVTVVGAAGHVTTHVIVGGGAGAAAADGNSDTGIGPACHVLSDLAAHPWVKLEPHWSNLMYLWCPLAKRSVPSYDDSDAGHRQRDPLKWEDSEVGS